MLLVGPPERNAIEGTLGRFLHAEAFSGIVLLFATPSPRCVPTATDIAFATPTAQKLTALRSQCVVLRREHLVYASAQIPQGAQQILMIGCIGPRRRGMKTRPATHQCRPNDSRSSAGSSLREVSMLIRVSSAYHQGFVDGQTSSG